MMGAVTVSEDAIEADDEVNGGGGTDRRPTDTLSATEAPVGAGETRDASTGAGGWETTETAVENAGTKM